MTKTRVAEGAKEVSRPRVSAEIESKDISRRSEREREREKTESLLGSRNLATACISYLYMHVVHFINVVQFLLLSKHEIHSSYDV